MRGTGRTTRMLQQAIALAEQGKLVVVLGFHPNHVSEMARMASNLAPQGTLFWANKRLRFPGGGEVWFWVEGPGHRLLGVSVDQFFVDHATWPHIVRGAVHPFWTNGKVVEEFRGVGLTLSLRRRTYYCDLVLREEVLNHQIISGTPTFDDTQNWIKNQVYRLTRRAAREVCRAHPEEATSYPDLRQGGENDEY